MNYRSVADLNDDIVRNLHRLPPAVDLVVGIPRSGLLAATMLALALNVPLTDVESFLKGRVLTAGRNRRTGGFSRSFQEMQNVLVIDDSISTGISLFEARQRVIAAYPTKTFTFCAVYGVSTQLGADIILEVVPHPRMFQWNLLHHNLLEQCCVDIDGVLCVDPTDAQNDDGEAYIRFLLEAPSLYIPTKTVGYLVTSRLEKYRQYTEAWLQSRGIRYRKLVMLELPSKAERQRTGGHAQFKGEVFKNVDALLFIESDKWQAPDIARISGKHVLCLETQELFSPDPLSPAAIGQKIRTLPRRLRSNHHSRRVKAIAHKLLRPSFYEGLKRLFGSRVCLVMVPCVNLVV